MTVDLVPLFSRAVDEFARRVRAVGADQWTAPTPDTEWDVRALVNHLVVEDLWAPPLLAGSTLAEVGDRFDGDQLGGDPAAAWASAASASIAAVAEDGSLDRTVHVSFGDISGREYVSQLTCDHLIHGWDLARATGLDERIAPEDIERLRADAQGFGEAMRGPGAFGPPLEAPPGADAQAELLAFLGRQP